MDKRDKKYIFTIGIWLLIALMIVLLDWLINVKIKHYIIVNMSLTLVIFVHLWLHMNPREGSENTD